MKKTFNLSYNQYSVRYLFALFGIINYPLFFVLERIGVSGEFLLRLVAIILCIGLIICVRFVKNRVINNIYWFCTITYCLPFFSSLFLLVSGSEVSWMINVILAVFLLLMITSFSVFCLSIVVGTLSGYITYLYFYSAVGLDLSLLKTVLFDVLWIIGVAILFNIKRSSVEEKTFVQNAELVKELKHKNIHLEEALTVKRRFLANISHEIRTPLHAVMGITQQLHEGWGEFKDKKRKELVNSVFECTERLTVFFTNILDMSQFLAKEVQFQKQICKLVALVSEAVKGFKNHKVDIKISKDIDDNCIVDTDRLKQVIRNLISNAVKYSNDGLVKVSVTNEIIQLKNKKQKVVRLSVSDNGVGIPKEDYKAVFQPFEESNRTKSKAGGKGLGLSLCYEIIKGHDGIIWIEANKPRGTIVSFVLTCN